ncbi:response regulator [Caldichromatium japonicum]|uniref:Response regulator n=1 Tax=Caldichromatium japonicum TaxID=2699430 RepID=A0A6G7VGN6_9GAMM|nr:HD domain-containing phosphohydrolase [Caldichromatium japonicum]QIK39154.1 response regulator [Caldichromatium japonicum]
MSRVDQLYRKTARILVVDDERLSLILMERLLKAAGYSNIVLVQDPYAFMKVYEEAPTDLILLDIDMPGLSGFDLIEQLAARHDPLTPPILVLTAQHSRDYRMRALELGASDFIAKPFDQAEVAVRVRNMLDVYIAHRLAQDQKAVLEHLVHERTHQIRATQLEIVRRLSRAAEYRDNETGEHILRMSHNSTLIAHHIGWDEERCELMLHASPMHDIGKIGIPDHILLKPGKLDPKEWAIMQTHATIGADILAGSDLELLQLAREIALSHHEKWDGSGYPRGLAGEAIPESGRIVALADVFDALTSARVYKVAWKVEDALDWMRAQSGKHFDPQLLAVFFELLPEILEIRERFKDPELTASA